MRHHFACHGSQNIEGDPERYTVRDRKRRPVGELERHGDRWVVLWRLDGWRAESRILDALAMLDTEMGGP